MHVQIALEHQPIIQSPPTSPLTNIHSSVEMDDTAVPLSTNPQILALFEEPTLNIPTTANVEEEMRVETLNDFLDVDTIPITTLHSIVVTPERTAVDHAVPVSTSAHATTHGVAVTEQSVSFTDSTTVSAVPTSTSQEVRGAVSSILPMVVHPSIAVTSFPNTAFSLSEATELEVAQVLAELPSFIVAHIQPTPLRQPHFSIHSSVREFLREKQNEKKKEWLAKPREGQAKGEPLRLTLEGHSEVVRSSSTTSDYLVTASTSPEVPNPIAVSEEPRSFAVLPPTTISSTTIFPSTSIPTSTPEIPTNTPPQTILTPVADSNLLLSKVLNLETEVTSFKKDVKDLRASSGRIESELAEIKTILLSLVNPQPSTCNDDAKRGEKSSHDDSDDDEESDGSLGGKGAAKERGNKGAGNLPWSDKEGSSSSSSSSGNNSGSHRTASGAMDLDEDDGEGVKVLQFSGFGEAVPNLSSLAIVPVY
ncbi:hypothetical protein OROMI_010971 [Orobanche minor]